MTKGRKITIAGYCWVAAVTAGSALSILGAELTLGAGLLIVAFACLFKAAEEYLEGTYLG